MEKPYVHTATWKNASLKIKYTVDSNYVTLWERQIYGASKNIRGLRIEREGRIGREVFEGGETILYDTEMTQVIIHLSKPAYTTQRMNFKVNCALGLTITSVLVQQF